MQRMAANMGGGNMPYMPPGAAEQMKNMKPEDFARASEELGQMDPETLKSQMNNFKNQNQAQRDYALRGAEQLKTDGNKLVGEGKYNEAIEKYMRVKNNLADDPSAGAKTLRQSCQLNMSLCFNKTKRYNSAISVSSRRHGLDDPVGVTEGHADGPQRVPVEAFEGVHAGDVFLGEDRPHSVLHAATQAVEQLDQFVVAALTARPRLKLDCRH